ncbi:cupin domain-containing protein [Nonomuraea jabiensis]|uniref:cupin domain-containing protein n=1 Tax=Nonomuraea jabiensis TaxID=882448 RepID=UPI003413CB84
MNEFCGPLRLGYDAAVVSSSGLAVTEVRELPAPFKCALFTVPQGATTELDQHDVAEMWFIHHGSGTLLSDGEELAVRAGDAIHFPGRVPHQLRNTGGEPLEVFSVWWQE